MTEKGNGNSPSSDVSGWQAKGINKKKGWKGPILRKVPAAELYGGRSHASSGKSEQPVCLCEVPVH